MGALKCALFGHSDYEYRAVVILQSEFRPVAGSNGEQQEVVFRVRDATGAEVRDGKGFLLRCDRCKQVLIHI